MQPIEQIRKVLLECYAAAIQHVEGEYRVAKKLPNIVQQHFTADELQVLRVIAIGKAADSMLQGALACLDSYPVKALLITKTGHVSVRSKQNKRIQWYEAGHPVPDQGSLLAGQALLEFLQAGSGQALKQPPCLFLISGGASSLVEVLADGWDLSTLQEVTQWMLGKAYDIQQINAVRQRISCIKGGGLWRILRLRKVVCLLISDVPQDDVVVIGSGLLFPPEERLRVSESLPDQWRDALPEKAWVNPPDSFYWKVVASNRMACKAALSKASQLGYAARIMPEFLQSDAEMAARHCICCAKKEPGVFLIWGAETTVVLPDNPGRGGRNQHLALAAAIEMAHSQCLLLAAGTDGTDGMTDEAGALVDGATLERGTVDGIEAQRCLQQADSGSFLYASGDLISTGVTGTNVMDLVIAYCQEKQPQ